MGRCLNGGRITEWNICVFKSSKVDKKSTLHVLKSSLLNQRDVFFFNTHKGTKTQLSLLKSLFTARRVATMLQLDHRGALMWRVRRVSVQGADLASQSLEHAASSRPIHHLSMYFYSDLHQNDLIWTHSSEDSFGKVKPWLPQTQKLACHYFLIFTELPETLYWNRRPLFFQATSRVNHIKNVLHLLPFRGSDCQAVSQRP